jgi:hypothetical protein
MDSCAFYCLSENNQERKETMKTRFEKLQLNVSFSDSIPCYGDSIENNVNKCKTCMQGHWDFVYHFFLQTDKEYCIIMEDDVHLHKDLVSMIPSIIKDFNNLNLDVLCLGYLIGDNPKDDCYHHHILQTTINNNEHNYYHFPDHLWGCQMYMLSRKHAAIFVDDVARKEKEHTVGADFYFTKLGNRALIYPMLAVEDGRKQYDHHGQYWLHNSTFVNNYKEDLYY